MMKSLAIVVVLAALAAVASASPQRTKREAAANGEGKMAKLSRKRGLADPEEFLCVDWDTGAPNFTYTYNWHYESACHSAKQNRQYVPMIWGQGVIPKVKEEIRKIRNGKRSKYNAVAMLGFNEPNHVSQSDLWPHEAAELWPEMVAVAKEAWGNDTLIGSPAAAPCGSANVSICKYNVLQWFDYFFGNCTGCQIDFVATHYYGCGYSGLHSLITSLKLKYGKPIWLTEFNCGDAAPSIPKQQLWMNESLAYLEGEPAVHHYSWMAGRDFKWDGHASLFETNSSTNVTAPTALGGQYLSFPGDE